MEASIADELANLPPLPSSVLQLQVLCNQPDTALRELAAVVEQDLLLTANLLRIANSPYYGYSGRVTKVEQMIILFGTGAVLGFALASAVRGILKVDLSPYGLDEEQFSALAQKRSSLAMRWYRRAEPSKRELLVPAAFLDGVGMVFIAHVLRRDGRGEVFRQALADGGEPAALERAFVGMTSSEVTAGMLECWHLDPLLVHVISPDPGEEPGELAQALQVIRSCVRIGLGELPEEEAEILEQARQSGLDAAGLHDALATIEL
jgi:HD-like signal output (HDOD) protein